MAKNQKPAAAPKTEEAPKAEEKPRATEAILKNKWFAPLISETIQNLVLLLLVTIGLRKPNQGNDPQQQGGVQERQVPGWIMAAFPSLTRDDDDEYSNILDSHPTPGAKNAAEEFKEALAKEGVYDDIRYVVNLVGLRRRFVEQTKNPSPEAKGSERISFQKITINDSAQAFLSELLVEKNAGGDVYENQKKRALRRNLLPKISVLKKFRIELIIGIFMIPWAFIQFLIWILS